MNFRSRERVVAVGLATVVAASMFVVLAAEPASAAPHVVQATFYASPTGVGADCSQASPCSLEGARTKVRASNDDMTGDIVVYLLGGTYELASTFKLEENATVQDSGTNGFDVIYRNGPGATPVLSGGKKISGFGEVDPVKHIWKADVDANLDTRQLYVDGVRATRARSATNPNFAVTSTGYTLPSSGFYNGMAGWGNVTNIEVAAQFSWKQARYSVAAIAGSAMTMDAKAWNDENTQPAYAARSMLWIENAKELLDAPGEWYLDTVADDLYYIPLAGQAMTAATEVIAGKTIKLVDGSGTLATPLHNVQFDGITFSHDTWLEPNTDLGYPGFQGGAVYRGAGTWDNNNYLTPAGVSFTAAKNIVVRNSTFTHMGNAALAFGAGSQYNLIDHNTFSDISGDGIDLGGITKADHHPSDPASIVKNNVISNNTVTTVGAEYRGNPAIFLGYTQGSDVRHNTLHNLPYTGISMGWGWGYIDTLGSSVAKDNLVRGNRIYDFMRTVNDGGAIYTLGSQLGSKVVDNYSYGARNPHGYLYRDNGSAGFTDSNNVISNQDSTVNTWYFTNSANSPSYYDAHDNLAEGNYHSAGMTADGTGTHGNQVGTNASVANFAWPAGASAVIAASGVGGADITPVATGVTSLSRGKVASASSTYATGSFGASKAVDGDPATRWAQASGTADPSWLLVDLGAQYRISGVNTSAYLQAGKGLKYKIEYSADNSVYSTYVDKTSRFTVPSQDTNAGNIVARYVRITLTATQGQGGSINEFDVFGTPVPPISQGKVATASSTYTGYDPAKAVDGDAASRWAQASGAADPSWLTVDLGGSYSINQVVTSAYLMSGLGVKYKIEYSADNVTYSMYADKTASFSTPGVDTKAGSITARWVKITFTATQGQGGSIYEFKVYGN